MHLEKIICIQWKCDEKKWKTIGENNFIRTFETVIPTIVCEIKLSNEKIIKNKEKTLFFPVSAGVLKSVENPKYAVNKDNIENTIILGLKEETVEFCWWYNWRNMNPSEI